MRKNIVAIITIVTMMALTACGNDAVTAENNTAINDTTETAVSAGVVELSTDTEADQAMEADAEAIDAEVTDNATRDAESTDIEVSDEEEQDAAAETSAETETDEYTEETMPEEAEDVVETETSENTQEQEAPAVEASVAENAVSGDIVLHTYVDFENDTYTLYSSTSTPEAGSVLRWSGVAEDCWNQVCALDASGKINYDMTTRTTTSFEIPESYAKYGVCIWMNAWECGFDRVIFWHLDGTMEINPSHN